MDPTANPALPLIITTHQILCGTCAWCRAGHGWPEQRQLERHAYPGQPSTRAHHVVQPCCCRYLVVNAKALGGDLVLDGPSGYHVLTLRAPIASLFLIRPNCPHHGHLANAHLIERLWDNPYLNGLLRDPYDLDDDERRGY